MFAVVEAVKQRIDTVISVDTRKSEVMRAAIAAGVGMINDVCALQTQGSLEIIAASKVAVCLMHMQGDPQTMQQNPYYHDVVGEVKDFLQQRLEACFAAGIARERIVIDPGFGFGKNLQHNLQLLQRLDELDLRCARLVGLSQNESGKIVRFAGGRKIACQFGLSRISDNPRRRDYTYPRCETNG